MIDVDGKINVHGTVRQCDVMHCVRGDACIARNVIKCYVMLSMKSAIYGRYVMFNMCSTHLHTSVYSWVHVSLFVWSSPGAVAVEFAPRSHTVKYPFHPKFCFFRNACAISGRWRRALQFLIEAIAYKAVWWNLENSVKKWAKIKMSKDFSFDSVTCTMLMLGIVCSQ